MDVESFPLRNLLAIVPGPFILPIWSFIVLVCTYISLRRWFYSSARGPLPPGPRGWPIIGNIPQLSKKLWLTFTEWKKDYGPVVYLSLAGKPVIVLNSYQAAIDLLDRRASIYSDRPRNIVASEILSGSLLIFLSPFNDIWRRMRRATHENLHKRLAPNYHPIQELEALLLTCGLLEDPESWDLHCRRNAASSILSIIYDMPTLKSSQDSTIKSINDYVARMSYAAYPGNHLVEFFPWMKHLPSCLAKWKREAEEWYAKDVAMFQQFYGEVETRQANGDLRPSFSASLISDKDRHGLDTTEAAYLAGTMYAAGADTTSATLAWFVHAMVLNPAVQQRAQVEIDAVVGRSRMPTFADFDSLPFTYALVKEILRLRPATPLGIPHALIQDDWYNGYLIPAGTICIPNVWGINRDPDIYGPDAHDFNPARFLDCNGKLDAVVADAGGKEEGHVTFGFGKRICVGRYIASNSLFIDVATILWALVITPARDSEGRTEIPSEECVDDGLVVRPSPFRCSITPRFPEVKSLLTHSKELHGFQDLEFA